MSCVSQHRSDECRHRDLSRVVRLGSGQDQVAVNIAHRPLHLQATSKEVHVADPQPGCLVAVRAQRPTELRIVVGVSAPAGQVPAVPTGLGGAAGSAGSGRGRGVPAALRVHEPEARGGEGGKHGRMAGDAVGDAFAAAQAGEDELVGVGR
jgi:hypothetical protein